MRPHDYARQVRGYLQHPRSTVRIKGRKTCRRAQLELEPLDHRVLPSGSSPWTLLSNQAPTTDGNTGIQNMMLLSNGNVLAFGGSNTQSNLWFQLAPDSNGDYQDGAWGQVPSQMSEQRLYFPSNVLPNGNVFVVGGEGSSPDPFTNTAEIFNPTEGPNGTWNPAAPVPTPPTNVDLLGTPTGASYTSPIVVTANNQLITGQQVTITGVDGNTAANGTFTVGNATATSFQLYTLQGNATQGNGAYTTAAITGVTAATATTPIVISTTDTSFLHNNDAITIAGVTGNTAANGSFFITGLTPTSFQLQKTQNPSTPNGAYTGGGTIEGYYASSASQFGDDPTEVLPLTAANPSGQVLAGFFAGPQTYIYDVGTNSWSAAASKLTRYNPDGTAVYDSNDEENWTKLPDGSILTYDIFASENSETPTFYAERYIPAESAAAQTLGPQYSNQWVDTPFDPNNPPQVLTGPASDGPNTEMGPAFLLPDGRVLQLGQHGLTAFYSEPTSAHPNGLWSAGPTIPYGMGTGDYPGCMMPNGDVLFVGSGTYQGAPANRVFLFTPNPNDPTNSNQITDVTPGNYNLLVNYPRMLMLPDGKVLMSNTTGQLILYAPTGAPQQAWAPAVTSISGDGNGTATLTGTQLNGISEGAAYGDDAEMSTNYPLIRLRGADGVVRYARTFNWSSTGVATGTALESVQFEIPAGVPYVNELSVIANGVSSAQVLFVSGDSNAFSNTITLDTLPAAAPGPEVTVNVNGTMSDWLGSNYAGVFVAPDIWSLGSNITVSSTLTGLPTFVDGGSIILGAQGSAQGIQGAVTMASTPAFDDITIDDSADMTARTVTLKTVTISNDLDGDSDLFGQITGLAPGVLYYEYLDTNSITIKTGSGDTIKVLATGTTTNLIGTAAAPANTTTVTVGPAAGGLGGILGTLNMSNPAGFDLIAVNDSSSKDGVATLGTFTPPSDSAWGSITGLSTGAINYQYSGTQSVTLKTGPGDLINVLATGTTTNLIGTGDSERDKTTVNVGLSGSLQEILGPLSVKDPTGPDVITVNDSAVGQSQATLGTYPVGITQWGSITGLSTGEIDYQYSGTQALTIDTGVAAVIDVLATGTTTNLIGSGATAADNTSVYVGVGGLLQYVKGTLNIENPSNDTSINVDDSLDNTLKIATFGVFANPSDSEANHDPWGFIHGLAPAAINYEYPDTSTITVSAGGGDNTYNVQGAGTTTILNTGSGNDRINLGSANFLVGFQAPLTINGQGGTDTLTAFDQASSEISTYDVTSSVLDVGASTAAGITYSGISTVVLHGSQAGSTYNIESTAPFTAYYLDGGRGNDTFNVSPLLENCDSLVGGLTVNGNGGTNTLIVNDQLSTSAEIYSLNAGILYVRQYSLGIAYTGLKTLTVNGGQGGNGSGGAGPNTFNIYSTNCAAIVNGGTGGATFDVGSFGVNSLDGIRGALTVNGQGGAEMLNINDQGNPDPTTYTLTATTLARTRAATITYGGFSTPQSVIKINGGSDGTGDVMNVDGTAGDLNTTYINGGGNGNQINVLGSAPNSVLLCEAGTGMGNLIRIGSLSHGPGDTAAHGGTLANIQGAVYALDDSEDQPGNFNLVIDDKRDTAAYPNVSLGNTELTGFGAPEYIYWEDAGLSSYALYGGSGATVYNINDLPANFSAETISTGTGTDIVNVGVEDDSAHGLTIHGQGNTVLNLNDQTITDTATYVVTTTSVTRTTLTAVQNVNPEVFTLNYDGMTSLALSGGPGPNTGRNDFFVYGTAAAAPLIVNAGVNTFTNVTSASSTLDGINGPVTVNGPVGDAFSIDDRGSTVGHTYTFTAMPSIDANVLTRSGTAPITYEMNSLQLTGGTGNNTFNIDGLSNNSLTRIYDGGGDDVFNVSPVAQNLDSIPGILDLRGPLPGQPTGSASLTVDDQQHADARNWLFELGAVVAYPSLGSAAHGLQVEFDQTYSSVVVDAGGGGNTMTVANPAPVANMSIDGGAGANTLVGPNTTNTWNVTGVNSGTIGAVSFTDMQNLVGGTGVDVFQFAAAGAETSINGGGAPAGMGDTLAYSGFSGPVTVDLPLGIATGVLGGISNIENVTGGPGNDLFVGNGAGNILTGGTGRNILIAGDKAGTLIGNSDQDLLVGGTTNYDTNLTALDAILAEWDDTAKPYAIRVQDLLDGGGLNGNVLLGPTEFNNNGGGNVLTGGPGLDLFYGIKALDTNDWNASLGEVFIQNPTSVSFQIGATLLSQPLFLLDGGTAVDTSSAVTLSVAPGPHTLAPYYGAGSPLAFTVQADGTINYSDSLGGTLGGLGTNTLEITGKTITIDGRALSFTSLRVDTVLGGLTDAAFNETLLPGPQVLADVYGGGSPMSFNVGTDGTVSYGNDPSLSGVLSGQGTTTLVVNGRTVMIDAHALSYPYLRIDTTIADANIAPFPVTILPGAHTLSELYGSGNPLPFQVANDGTVSVDSSVAGIASVLGNTTLVVHGVTVTIDARALSYADLALDTLIEVPTAAPKAVTLLPGLQALGSTYGQGAINFTVGLDGKVSYGSTLDGVLSGQNTTTLVVVGEALHIDATAIVGTISSFSVEEFAGLSTAQVQTLQVLPGTFDFSDSTLQFSFMISPADGVSYPSTVGSRVSGSGTNTLVILS